jgi:hypothetical protein
MPLSAEFQRCLLAPREMDLELKNFRLTAPPIQVPFLPKVTYIG